MCISLIGTGKVAFNLARRLHQKNIPIDLIIGRDKKSDIGRWSMDVGGIKIPTSNIRRYTTDYSEISPETELIIIAVSDDAIDAVAQKLSPFVSPTTLVVHTSGSVPSTILKPHFKNFGTLYPLQTFTKNFTPDFDHIPIFYNITSSSKQKIPYYEELLMNAAYLFSPIVYYLNDADRLTLHIAAVLVNNFTNHLFSIAKNLLSEKKIPFNVLLPLIQETVRKIETQSPSSVQTGPAIRGDNQTIEKHLALLADKNILYRDIYDAITKSIIREV